MRQGLYDPANEHDACGVGFIAHIKGRKVTRSSSRACEILKNLDHRGAVGADPLMGDGAGILIQIPDPLSARRWPSRASACRAPATTASAWCSCPRSSRLAPRL
jgi:glutamate synthase (NADPH/NADH) large chain